MVLLPLLLTSCIYTQPNNYLVSSGKKSGLKLKFAVDLHTGATVDITGNFKGTGYNFGGGLSMQTSEHLEAFGDFNSNYVKDRFENTTVNFTDYSFGLRIFLGKEHGRVKPFIETALGVYPDFRDFREYNGSCGGINFGFGVLINAGNKIGIIVRPKLHLAVITGGHPGGGFYVYSGFYGGLRYSF